MERFERAAEAKKRRQTEQGVKIVVQETAEIFAGIESPNAWLRHLRIYVLYGSSSCAH